MLRFLRNTWLPTVVFAALGQLVSHSDRSCGWIYRYGSGLVAVVLVPPLWRWFVVPEGRPCIRHAALTGAVIAYLVFTLPMMMPWGIADARLILSGKKQYAELGGLALGFMVLLVLGAVPVAGAIGAGIGSLLALVQRSTRAVVESAVPDTRRDGAWGGGMIACLAGPFTAVLTALILPPSMLPTIPGDRNVSFPLVLMSAWILTIPVGALLGVGWVERWRRLAARHAQARSSGASSNPPAFETGHGP